MPKFSVIIPIYNVETYIEDCVNSVLDQTYNDYEVILVNDASPDQSLAIIQKQFQHDKRVLIIDKPHNEGVALARSTGLARATGDYVLYLDGDDQLVSNALDVLNEKIETSKAEVVIFPKIREHHGEKFVASYFDEERLFKDDRKALFEGFLKYGYFVIGYAAIKRELALTYDMAKDLRNIWLGEDLIQSLPLLTHAQSVLYITEGLYIMTYNPGSVTRNKVLRKDRYLQAIETHKVLERYLALWGIKELTPDFYEHVMRDAIVYACDGIWSTSSLTDGVEFLKTIGNDRRFVQAYQLGFPRKKSSKVLAFLLKGKHFRLAYCAIKIKGWRLS